MKRAVTILASLAILASVMTGCTQTTPPDKTPSTRIVVDQIGNVVELPETIDEVANFCYQMVEVQIALGAGDKLVAGSYYGDVPWLDESLKSLPNPYNWQTGLNVEELVSVDPDLVVMWGGTPQDAMDMVWDAGYPVVCDWTMGQGTTEEAIEMLGKALGKEAEADEILAYWADQQAIINDVINDIPEGDRLRVFYTGHDKLITCAQNTDEDWWISEASGINVARDASGLPWGSASWWMELSIESVIAWDPDVIIISSKAGIDPDDILNDPQWKDIKAVQDGKVYRVPFGYHVWDRPCAERILGQLWLAQKLYPDKFTSIDIRQETRDFFETFFRVNLSEEEVDDILAGVK